ncbi:AI-2E family transporter [Telluribacter sp. SYSU D00476]|uniref:AI-2E family transporter n=1 Tax=Telluribacter sp. SYSU D00476 TaxID=2811430 RepID=UPI001FF28D99|nr:AI-2E family transporter [Telluribacter sp. SYSU D00476]
MKGVSIYRATAALLFLLLFIAFLYIGRPFLVPLCFSIILSMLFLPVSRKLEDWGLSRLLATITCLLILVLIITGFMWVITAEITRISQDMDDMQPRLQQVIRQIQRWINQEFGIPPSKQIQFVDEQAKKFSQSSNNLVKGFLNGILGMISSIVLVLIYMLFMIWQRDKYKRFFLKITSRESKPEAKDTIREITQVSSKYLGGRLISMLFLVVFYGIGFSVVGLQNAILMSLLAVLPSIVPYVGPFVGSFFPISMALLSGSTDLVIPTIMILVLAQVIDNNLIEPFVMGANMNLSPLMIIIAIVTGQLIWGVAGMILFIPLFAVIRAICDHIPTLSPYGFLMQDDISESVWIGKIKNYFKGLTNKKEE